MGAASLARLPLAVDASALDQWASSAMPGDKIIYATGPELPRGSPAVAMARTLANVGLVTLTTRALDGGRDFIAIRCAIDPNKAAAPRHAPVQEDELTELVFRRLSRAANLGQVCPTNAELARDCGLPDAAAASYRIRKLIAAKRVRIEDQGPNRRRIVTIVKTGRCTVPGAL